MKLKEINKPLAIIIKGNPKYLNKNKDIANNFYNNIKTMLEEKGYRVKFNNGEPYTQPENADLWVAHSRGIDRLKFANKNTKTIALQTKNENDGMSPNHYQLSNKDKKSINNI